MKIQLPQRTEAPAPGVNRNFDAFLEEWCEWEPENREGWWYEWMDYEFAYLEEKQDQHKQAYIMAYLHERLDREVDRAEKSENDVKSYKQVAAEHRRRAEEK